MEVLLDQKTHKYSIDGLKAVGVNELLNSFGIGVVPPGAKENFRRRAPFGKAGHEMARYHFEGRLKEETLPKVLFPYLVGLKKLCIEHKIEPIALEEKIGYKTLLVCGTPDILCLFDGVKCFLDWKFVKVLRKHYQLCMGGYRYIYNANQKEVEEIAHPGKIIQLIPNDYKIVDEEFDTADQFGTLLEAHHIRRIYG